MGVLNGFLNGNLPTHGNHTHDVWTVLNGQDHKDTGRLILQGGPRRAIFSGSAAIKGYDWILNVATAIDELSYAETTYANIVRQRIFRQLYQFGNRTLSYIQGTVAATINEDSFPCQVCGLVVPVRLCSIDHTRPQSGGEIEALAKVMRVLGMTVRAGTGSKSAQLGGAVQAATHHPGGVGAGLYHMQMNQNFAPVPTAMNRAPKVPSPQAQLNDRYTLTWEGSLFYSVCAAVGAHDILETRCMHSIVNLRPVCPSCNSTRGNPLKF